MSESVHEALASPGDRLPAGARAFFEPRFGRCFADVRMHADARAGVSARAMGAIAYTVGWNVVLGERAYDPVGHKARSLLAHELAHVVQQRAGMQASRLLQRKVGPVASVQKAGDEVNITVYGLPTSSTPD